MNIPGFGQVTCSIAQQLTRGGDVRCIESIDENKLHTRKSKRSIGASCTVAVNPLVQAIRLRVGLILQNPSPHQFALLQHLKEARHDYVIGYLNESNPVRLRQHCREIADRLIQSIFQPD